MRKTPVFSKKAIISILILLAFMLPPPLIAILVVKALQKTTFHFGGKLHFSNLAIFLTMSLEFIGIFCFLVFIELLILKKTKLLYSIKKFLTEN